VLRAFLVLRPLIVVLRLLTIVPLLGRLRLCRNARPRLIKGGA